MASMARIAILFCLGTLLQRRLIRAKESTDLVSQQRLPLLYQVWVLHSTSEVRGMPLQPDTDGARAGQDMNKRLLHHHT